MIKLKLSEEEKKELQKLRLNRNSNEGERAHYILLADEGYSVPQIANRLDRNTITIRTWLKRYMNEGIKGLESRKQPGRPAVKAIILESDLELLLSKQPKDYGYQEAGWQINLLRNYFARQGCHVCENTLVKALKKLGYVYKRFSKTTPRNAPSAAEKAKAVKKLVDRINKGLFSRICG